MATSDTREVARQVRSALSRDLFRPATTRLLWVPVHLAIFVGAVAASMAWTSAGRSVLWLLPLSLLVGMSFAGLAFVAHEALHGSLSRHRIVRRIAGFVGFFPFWVSPRLWIAWHNRVHHGNTNVMGRDPDAYPDLKEYETNAAARRAVDWGAPRRGSLRGFITLALGFTVQSLQILVFAGQRGFLSSRHHRAAWLETLAAIGTWVAFGFWVGVPVFLVAYLVPLLVGNAIVMAHIITNHSLSPQSDENDALETSLTVTVPRWFEFYSLGFGYHVEHHLFPAMSNRYAPQVRDQLRRLAPGRYQEMPLSRALRLMFTTPRIYRDHHTLVDPKTGFTFTTLGKCASVAQGDDTGVESAVDPSIQVVSAHEARPAAFEPSAPSETSAEDRSEVRPRPQQQRQIWHEFAECDVPPALEQRSAPAEKKSAPRQESKGTVLRTVSGSRIERISSIPPPSVA